MRSIRISAADRRTTPLALPVGVIKTAVQHRRRCLGFKTINRTIDNGTRAPDVTRGRRTRQQLYIAVTDGPAKVALYRRLQVKVQGRGPYPAVDSQRLELTDERSHEASHCST
ncbi:hypothetical protein EVAR_92587_1 [Eumeta japonica]|uniref:Uncharacterized protein n=1 Tax=Eumeta variegata TaxID=151549 RepID=A0A4C1T013_EUMVA|nr:hypothetical protein EVAR_92587_1 [Eumeta japonica]